MTDNGITGGDLSMLSAAAGAMLAEHIMDTVVAFIVALSAKSAGTC